MAKDTLDEIAEMWLKSIPDEAGNLAAGNWMAAILPHLSLVQTSPTDTQDTPVVSFAFTVRPKHCNRMNSLHGGCIASIFDFTTTLSLARIGRPGFWDSLGVSRSLSVTYLRPAPAGTELLIDCEVVQVGRTLAALRGSIKRRRDGQLVAVCEHGKVNVDSGPRL
ncbi:hypothetical protein Sste5346_004236 [Sporothrix stenoceras]|uniref:Thioesterase domain-containing protein n=1 Tax=Sporothrix stenoceras TaxID=5173 RepID=A0ABR3Z9Y7_9PEZI